MIDRKNAILITGVLTVAVLVGFVFPYLQYRHRAASVPTAIPDASAPVTIVRYTNKGFEPASITVAAGTTVEWVNESDKLMWVGSDPHPVHNGLPGLNQGGIESNVDPDGPFSFLDLPAAHAHGNEGFYQYTFRDLGGWGYHNHLAPADRGTVIVE